MWAVVLTTMTPDITWRHRAGQGPDIVVRQEPVLRLSSLLMVRDAVLAGAGVAMLPRLLVTNDVAAGRLALWGPVSEPPFELWVLQSSHRLVGAEVRAFLDVVEKDVPRQGFYAAACS
jgi:DNA-binding transcriptional LysR family regulator